MANRNFTSTNSNKEFGELAKKLRMERFDPDELAFYKQTALQGEKLRNRKKKMATIIQKFYRGHLVRKIVNKQLEIINNEAVIKHLKNKRENRIKKKSKELISFYLNLYCKKQREMKRLILYDYFNYCSGQITSNIKGFIFRKEFMPYFMKYKESKRIIFEKLILTRKVQNIMRCNMVNNIVLRIKSLKEIIKIVTDNSERLEKVKSDILELKENGKFNDNSYYLKENMNSENENDTENEKRIYNAFFNKKIDYIKGLMEIKLRKEYSSFYNLYYKVYLNGKWIKRYDTKEIEIIKDSKDLLVEEYMEVKYYDPLLMKFKGNEKKNQIEVEKKDSNDNEEENMENIPDNNNENENIDNDAELNNEFINPDDRVIKPNQGYNLSEIPGEEINTNQENIKSKRNIEHLKRKQPKYDARKAIEDSKKKEKDIENKEKDNKKSAFRDMLKEIKKNKDDDNNQNVENSEKDLENDLKTKLKEINSNTYNNSSVPTPTNIKGRKKETDKTYEKRKKLHEMERSPKKVNVNKVKSKIDCWGNDNSSTPAYSYKRKHNEVKKVKFNPQILSRIEQEVQNIENKLMLSNHKKTKDEMFKDTGIAYIKEESFYVKHYSPEIYDQLLIHLNKHYEELKN